MRLLIVNSHGNDPTVGGVEKGIQMLSHALIERGHTITYLNAFPGGRPEPAIETTVLHRTDWREDPVRRKRNHLGDVISRPTRELARVVGRHRPDVVHTHNLPGISTGIWEVCRRQGVPVVHTLHDYHLLCPRVTLTRADGTTPCRPHPLLCGLRTRRLARWSGAVSQLTGVSTYLIDLHAPLFPRAEKHVVRNPMVLPERAQPIRPPSARLGSIGYIGGLYPTKGVEVLLAAAPALAELGCEIHVGGGGPLAGDVAAAAARLPSLHYHGVVSGETKDRFFESCDVGVIPSLWAEPGGPTHTLIEWLCSGRPVLVSRRGGLGEVAQLYSGAIAIEPSLDGIVAAVAKIADPTTWQGVISRLDSVDRPGALDRWVGTYERIYRAAQSAPR